MAFPSSFETNAVIRLQPKDQLDATRVAAFLEQSIVEDGAQVSTSDGTYFEFRFSLIRNFLVRSGAITTRQVDHDIAVRAEATVRVAPALVFVAGMTMLPAVSGLPPVGAALGLLLSGGFVQYLYFKAVVAFRKYVERLCSNARIEFLAAAKAAEAIRKVRG